MIDLSKPNEFLITIETYLLILRRRVDAILSKKVQIREKLMSKICSKIGDDHPVHLQLINIIDVIHQQNLPSLIKLKAWLAEDVHY
uniref:Uncharacterized protein n=1 Tax=Romanomermis culicivorax TaxID=13658 RepID=A0A915HEL9_ROMCU